MEGLVKILRDLIHKKYLSQKEQSSYFYNIERISSLSLSRIEYLHAKIEAIYKSYRNNVNFELSIENIFLNIYREGRIL